MARTTTKKAAQTDIVQANTAAAVCEQAASAPKKFNATDLITCRSITQGELLMQGKKSEILYRWSAYGDTAEIEYQDLYALRASRSEYIYRPHFIIEDNALLSDPKWADVKMLYDKIYENENMAALLGLPLAQFKRALTAAPEGYRRALAIEAATRIEDGSFDSMNKIKAIDQICGTDLAAMFH